MSLKVMQRIFSFVLVAGMMLGFVAPTAAQPSLGDTQRPITLSAEKVEDLVLSEIEANGQTDFLVLMATQADLSRAADLNTKLEKGQYVFETVRSVAEQTQKGLRSYLDGIGLTYQPFYVINSIFVQGGDINQVLDIAARTDVASIAANHKYQLQQPFDMTPAGPISPDVVEPNLTFINVDDAWAMGVTGAGTVMAGNDTGLDWEHPAIIGKYRGWNGSTADHNYNWWDAWDWSPLEPADDYGHGTHTTGTMVGDDGAGNQIGVAPGAQTIHCKNMSGGGGDDAHFIECFEWDLAPWDLNGDNPLPAMAPDAVNNSWGYAYGGNNAFRTVINNLQAAGIAVEVSAGNEGPSCQTLRSPGDYNEVLTTGSVDHVGQTFPGVVTGFSSRGPSSLDGNYFPDIMAPGNSVRSAVPGTGYEYWSGTSMAGPHATALVGLIWSACPAMQGDVETAYQIIMDTAEPLTGQVGSCGGDYTVGPNNDWGYGTIDAEAAVQLALAMCTGMGAIDGTVTDMDSGLPIEGAFVEMDWDGGGSWSAETDETGYYYKDVPIGIFTVSASHPLYETNSVSGVEVITDTTTTQDIELTPRGLLFGYVTDFDSGMALEGAVVTADDGTTDETDADGFYEMYLDEGTFDVEVTLENYAPGHATVDILSGEDTQQDFALKGAIAFTPAPVLITLDMGDAGIMLDATLINRQPWDYAFEFGEKDEGFIPVLAGMQTVTLPAKTSPTGTATSGATVPERSFNLPAVRPMAAPNVLLVAADDDVYYGSPIQAELLAYGDLGLVDLFNAISGTPTLAQLEAYDVVVVWSNYVFSNPTGMGDVLADYVDGGGKVIDLMFAIDPNWGFGGRWVAENYTAIKGTGTSYINSCLGAFDPGHPIMDGVTNVCDIYRLGGSYLTPDSTEVALWADGEYFVAIKDNLPVVTMNTYMGYFDYSADQEDLVLHNAILWLAEGGTGVLWLGEDPISSTVPASSTVPGELDVTLYFTATADVGVTQPGDYLATLKVNGDPSMDVPVVMTVNAPETWGKIFGNVSSLGYCDDDPYPLEEAIVWLTTASDVYSVTTDEYGDYQLWLDESESPVDVSVDYLEHVGQVVEDVMIDPDVPQEVNFELRWDYPCVGATPDSLSATLEWGDNSTQPMDISNGGAAELNFLLKEADKGWMPAIYIPVFEGTLPEDTRPVSTDRAPQTGLNGEKVAPLAMPLAGPQAFAMDIYPGYNLVEIPDLEIPGNWNIIANIPGNQYFAGDFINGDFSTLWVIDYGTLSLYAVDTATGAVTMIGPTTPYGGESWTGMTGANDGTMYASSTNISRSTLYTVDLGTGTATVVGEITNAPAIIDIAINGSGEMFGVDIVNDVLIQIDPSTGAGTVVGSLGANANYAQGMDFDEETGILYWAAYISQGELRVIDTSSGASALIGAFPGGAETDCLAVATGGAAADVPWLSEDIITGTIPADSDMTVNVTMDSMYVDQPGDYYATLAIKSDDPINKTLNVPVTMTVLPAEDMGKITGLVWDACLDTPLEEVLVSIAGGDPITMTYTDADGGYTTWLVEGLYTFEFIMSGYVTFSADVTIVAGDTVVLDVALVPDRPCMKTEPSIIEEWVLTNTEVYTFAGGFDITNNGAQDLIFTLFEVPPMASACGGVDSLSGSFVVFDPSIGGDDFYIPGMEQTFCFHTESFTNDWEYVYSLWERFPAGWEVSDVTVEGTPYCDSGSFSSFSWSFESGANEIEIYHPRYQAPTDHCYADYCVTVTSAPGMNALVSWFWDGDGYGGIPHWPCSDDGYAPPGFTCDQAINPQAEIPVGSVDFPWFWADPVTGTVPAESMFNVGIYFSSISDTVPMPIGDYEMTLFADSNDPVNPSSMTPVILHVVEEYIVPEASFEAAAEVCEDADLVFTNTTVVGVPPITDYLWDFGDGGTSTEENPVHVFEDADVYTVTLEACNREGCTDFSQAVEVLPKPEAMFTFTSYSLEATFTNASLYADSYMWDFGDGTTSTDENPVHVFETEGPYTVVLWAYNECGVASYEAIVTLDEVFIYVLPLQYKAIP